MQLVNETPYQALWTIGYGKDGRERMVVAIKATYRLPEGKGRESTNLELAREQVALTGADEFEDDSPKSAPLRETDFAHVKPRCDVLVTACAYAKSASRTEVEVRVDNWSKRFRVIGSRVWRQRGAGAEVSDPEPFERLPISYTNAFGGTEENPRRPGEGKSYATNPVGVGYHPYVSEIDGLPVPCTEEIDKPITTPTGKYRPMALGPIGRSWEPRPKYAGTYDESWTRKRAPYLPDDFDERYFQAAPADQQIAHCRGGERVTLLNLTPSHRLEFRMPGLAVPVLFAPRSDEASQLEATVDTVSIEPEAGIVCLTARTSYQLRRNMFELSEIVIGGRKHSWFLRQRARLRGKTYYPSLGALGRKRGPDDE